MRPASALSAAPLVSPLARVGAVAAGALALRPSVADGDWRDARSARQSSATAVGCAASNGAGHAIVKDVRGSESNCEHDSR